MQAKEEIKDDDYYARKHAKERAEDMEVITPKIDRLLRNNKLGISLKRFIKRELEADYSLFNKTTVQIVRVESLRNDRKFNAVINYRPLMRYDNGKLEKYSFPYQIIVDRAGPWTGRYDENQAFSWKDLKRRIHINYKIVESYGL